MFILKVLQFDSCINYQFAIALNVPVIWSVCVTLSTAECGFYLLAVMLHSIFQHLTSSADQSSNLYRLMSCGGREIGIRPLVEFQALNIDYIPAHGTDDHL